MATSSPYPTDRKGQECTSRAAYSTLKQGRKEHSELFSGHLLAGEMEWNGKGPDSVICDALFWNRYPK